MQLYCSLETSAKYVYFCFSVGCFYPIVHAVWSETTLPESCKLLMAGLSLSLLTSLHTQTHTHTHTHTHMLVFTRLLAHFQVDTVGTSLDLSHVFLLDAGNEIFIWCGSKSSLMSRSKARLIAEKMNKYERKNRARIVQFRSVRAVYCGVCRIKVIIVNVSFFLGY